MAHRIHPRISSVDFTPDHPGVQFGHGLVRTEELFVFARLGVLRPTMPHFEYIGRLRRINTARESIVARWRVEYIERINAARESIVARWCAGALRHKVTVKRVEDLSLEQVYALTVFVEELAKRVGTRMAVDAGTPGAEHFAVILQEMGLLDEGVEPHGRFVNL